MAQLSKMKLLDQTGKQMRVGDYLRSRSGEAHVRITSGAVEDCPDGKWTGDMLRPVPEGNVIIRVTGVFKCSDCGDPSCDYNEKLATIYTARRGNSSDWLITRRAPKKVERRSGRMRVNARRKSRATTRSTMRRP